MIYIIFVIFIAWTLASFADLYLYKKRLEAVPLRVHVNGIRGKSSIVRYIAAILRGHGYQTLAKTTGTAPRIIDFDGNEIALKRAGKPNIFEQLLLMKYFLRLKPQAVVVECMAVNPAYSEWLENKVMNSHVYIMTNVRLDHQDQLGYTLEEIAKSLASSLPQRATVITGETNPNILSIFREACEFKDNRLMAPCCTQLLTTNDIDISEFTHAPILENIQVCLTFASLLNISRSEALRAMALTNPDPGHFRLRTLYVSGVEIAWANLFAVNDKESFIEWVQILLSVHQTYDPIVILNNRKDRVERVPLFAQIVKDLQIKKVVAFGDCELMVADNLEPETYVLKLGNTSLYANINGKDLLRRIVSYYRSSRILLIGAVNIHTKQADNLLEYLNSDQEEPEDFINDQ